MTLSLDTNVLIDVANGRQPLVRARYQACLDSGEHAVVSAFVAHEFFYGALIARRTDRHVEVARRILSAHPVIDWTGADSYAAARLRADLRRTGLGIGSVDVLIAGQALARGWTLVTANTREFERIEGLQVQDWSRGET